MKSYTDLEQSKRLAEFLPLKSADMRFCFSHRLDGRITGHYPMIGREPSSGTIPCWSLAALLNVTNMVVGRVVDSDIWICASHKLNLSLYADNPIDACYEMILRLHGQKLL